jgi:hypothetical protein
MYVKHGPPTAWLCCRRTIGKERGKMLSRMYGVVLVTIALLAVIHLQANAQSLETGNCRWSG